MALSLQNHDCFCEKRHMSTELHRFGLIRSIQFRFWLDLVHRLDWIGFCIQNISRYSKYLKVLHLDLRVSWIWTWIQSDKLDFPMNLDFKYLGFGFTFVLDLNWILDTKYFKDLDFIFQMNLNTSTSTILHFHDSLEYWRCRLLTSVCSYVGIFQMIRIKQWKVATMTEETVSYTHLTLPTNREV